ncbi:MAG: deoxyhypusine synthase [Desulfurococcaceae archaeon]
MIYLNDVKNELRKKLLNREVLDRFIEIDINICDLLNYYRSIHGFTASHIVTASEILYEMLTSDNTFRIISFTGNIVATGLRGLITQMIMNRFFDAIITTCGAIDHDIAKSTGCRYYCGNWFFDDTLLRKIEIHRLGNIFIPFENYGLAIENFTKKLLDELVSLKKTWTPSEILYEAGRRINDRYSILKSAFETNTPVFVPGIFDGAFGTQIAIHSQFSGIQIDLIRDELKLLDMFLTREKIGALIIGGGISKHHTIWFAQFREGLDYAIYITTAVEYDGSLSGAHPREAISWNKLKPESKNTIVYGDATVVLPLIFIGTMCLLREKQ